MFSERRSYSPRTASLVTPGNIAGLAIPKDKSIVFFEIERKRRVHFIQWKPHERLTMKVCVISTHELILVACELWQEF